MKNLVILAFLLIPSVSLAAPLTTDQAISLINVVQSSPQTPASAFTDLITAFSNITVPQAESLISVIQQAPGVPANAFVNMLLAFTVDPVLGATTPESTTPSVNNQPVQTTPEFVVTPVESPIAILDTASPYTGNIQVYTDGNIKYLTISTNEPITYSLNHGVIEEVVTNGVRNESVTDGDRYFGKFRNPYMYKAIVSGLKSAQENGGSIDASTFVKITLTDSAGNSATKSVQVQ